jgi:hypothetical protein
MAVFPCHVLECVCIKRGDCAKLRIALEIAPGMDLLFLFAILTEFVM